MYKKQETKKKENSRQKRSEMLDDTYVVMMTNLTFSHWSWLPVSLNDCFGYVWQVADWAPKLQISLVDKHLLEPHLTGKVNLNIEERKQKL